MSLVWDLDEPSLRLRTDIFGAWQTSRKCWRIDKGFWCQVSASAHAKIGYGLPKCPKDIEIRLAWDYHTLRPTSHSLQPLLLIGIHWSWPKYSQWHFPRFITIVTLLIITMITMILKVNHHMKRFFIKIVGNFWVYC